MKRFLPALSALFLLVFLQTQAIANATTQPPSLTPLQQAQALNAKIKSAMLEVIAIVNQPVTHYQRHSYNRVSEYKPGWFHAGALIPDYNTVDIRRTQTFPYAKQRYVTSDLNPGEMFVGSDLEFNSMTKYFYTDRKNPKKKLTEAEMLRINALYRIIGASQQQLAELKDSLTPFPLSPSALWHSPYATLALMVGMLLGFIALYKKRYMK